MVYDYLITLFNLVVGLVTKQRLLYAFIIAFGFYLLWVIFALCFCFQRKFYTKSVKLYNKLQKSDNLADKQNLVDKYSTKFSLGFEHGWKKFKSSNSGKPSMFLSRNEVLDSEFSGGILNQGKSFMKSYIWLTTILLILFNIAFRGGSEVITFSLLAESLVLPIIYLIVLRIFYYLYTSVKQQIYKLDIEVFYELVDLLDLTFAKSSDNNENQNVANNKIVSNFEDNNQKSKNEIESISENSNTIDKSVNETEMLDKKAEVLEDTNEPIETENYSNNEVEVLDNDKNNANETEPQENVTDTKATASNNLENDFGSSSGNAIDLEEFEVEKERKINFDEIDEDDFQKDSLNSEITSETNSGNFDEILKDTVSESETNAKLEDEDVKSENKEEVENVKEIDTERELEKFDVFKKKNIDVKNLSNEVPSSVQSLPFINVDSDYVIKDDEDGFGKRVTPNDNGSTVLGVIQDMSSIKKTQSEVNKTQDSNAESNAESEGDDPQGGKVITSDKDELSKETVKGKANEKTIENISQESSDTKEVAKNDDANNNESEKKANSKNNKVEEVSQEDKVASIVGGFKSSKNKLSTGGVMIEKNTPITRRNKNRTANDNNFSDLVGNNSQGNNFGQMNEFNVSGYDQGFGVGGQIPQYGYPNQPVGFGTMYGYPNQQPNYNGYENYNNISGFGGMPGAYDFSEQKTTINKERKKSQVSNSKPSVSQNTTKPKTLKAKPVESKELPKVRVIEEENLTKDTASSKKRGRPKKQIFDEEVTINSDREFNEVLARAEKLMRKSEEGLSASQSKRIEKELKMLMDAMNLYKERK